MEKIQKGMDGKRQADQHQRNASNYLHQSEDVFVIDPATGLYHPKPIERAARIDEDSHEQTPERPIFVFSEDGGWSAQVIAIATVAGVLVSSLTLVLLIFTVLFAHNQWHEARRQADASIASANAGRKSAKAAENAVAIARDALEIENRPWLAVSAKVTKFNWNEIPQGRPLPTITTLNFQNEITVENFGNLPASNVYVIYDENPIPKAESINWWNMLMEEQEKYCRAKIDAGNLIRETWPGGVTVFPHQQHTFDETSRPPQEFRENPGNLHLYIRGCVVYRSPTHKEMRQSGFFYTVQRNPPFDGRRMPFFKERFENIVLLDQSGETKSD